MSEKTEHCQKCGSQFDRSELEHCILSARTGRANDDESFWACGPCSILAKATFYQEKFFQAKDIIDSQRNSIDLMRNLMMAPATIDAVAADPLTSPIGHYLRERRAGLEGLSIEGMQFYLQMTEGYARLLSELIGKKMSKADIKAQLEAKTQKVIKEAVRNSPSKTPSERKKFNAEEKAIQGCMKLGLTREQAIAMVNSTMNHGKE